MICLFFCTKQPVLFFIIFGHSFQELFVLAVECGVVRKVALLARLGGRESVVYQTLRVGHSLFVYVVHKRNSELVFKGMNYPRLTDKKLLGKHVYRNFFGGAFVYVT